VIVAAATTTGTYAATTAALIAQELVARSPTATRATAALPPLLAPGVDAAPRCRLVPSDGAGGSPTVAVAVAVGAAAVSAEGLLFRMALS
jgi:hypothetical protein